MRKGFTLIELLVVIAIIGLLASIVTVSLSSSQDRAKQAKIESFAAQVHHALFAYAAGVWDLDGNANDTSGLKNHATSIVGATPTTNRYDDPNKAYQFAASQYITMGDRDDLDFERTDTFTIAGWFKRNVSSTYSLLSKHSGSNPSPGYYLLWLQNLFGGKLQFYFQNTDSSIASTTQNEFTSLTDWYHIVVVYNGNNSSSGISIYVNGVKEPLDISGGTLTNNTTKNTQPFNIGSAFVGKIDDVRVYKSAISSAQIQQLYAQGLPSHISLISSNQ